MLEVAFQYDETLGGKWVPCENPIYIHEDIEKIPYFLVLGDPECENFKGYSVLCPKHHKIENVAELQRSRIVSAEGCVIEGLIAMETYPTHKRSHPYGYYWISSYYSYGTEGVLIPFRWRIFQKEAHGPVNIACDVAEIHHKKYLETGNFRQWHTFSISADMGKKKRYITQVMDKKRGFSIKWMDETGIVIPEIVLETSMELLRESTRLATGIKPSVISQMKGNKRLMAYIERPFDINIVFLKEFLREYVGNNFDEIFPYECKDNYRKICQFLDIKPPKSLRKAYGFNPYAIVWYVLFQQWGIKDINLMQRFLYLDRWVASIPLDVLYYDKNAKRIERGYGWGYDDGKWKAIERFCIWMISQIGEKKSLRWLYQISMEDGIQDWQWDIVKSFYQYEQQISDELKRILLRDGLTLYVHDQISWEVTAFSKGLKDVHIPYEPHILAYECNINGHEFRLVHDTRTLRHAGLLLQNCVATYREAVIGHHSIIVTVCHKGRYVACIEIQREKDIVQALGVKNQHLSGEVLRICRFWAERNGLNLATNHLDMNEESMKEAGTEDLEEFVVEAVPYQNIEKIGLAV